MPSKQRNISNGSLTVRTEAGADCWTVFLRGELDLANAATAEAALQDAFDATVAEVVVDMRELEFIDSTGIALLVNALGHNGDSARLRFIPSSHPAVTRVLDLTGVSERLPLAE
jgi:anti-sigma B factor antagonist